MAAQYDVPGRSPLTAAETLWESLSVGGSDDADIGLCEDCQTILDLAVEQHNQTGAEPDSSPAGGESDGTPETNGGAA